MIVNLFAGPGGWEEGLRLAGCRQPVLGVELDPVAATTRDRAGWATLHADVRSVVAADLAVSGHACGLIASPPCQTFSQAGPGEGRKELDDLARWSAQVLDGAEPVTASADPRTLLVLEALRLLRELDPEWVVFEEVKGVLPLWQVIAGLLRDRGYSVWAERLNAADFGVPQVRKRAFMFASKAPLRALPEWTHAEKPWLVNDLFTIRKPWVTMAEALDFPWPPPQDDTAWAWHRPATTIVRSFRPDIVAAPGYRSVGDPSRQNAPGSIEVTPEQMMILQGTRTDYPFAGQGGKYLSQIGAILPPPWAAAILRPILEVNPPCH